MPSGAALPRRPLSYEVVGSTSLGSRPAWAERSARLGAWRPFEARARVGSGDECWRWASAELLSWGVKTRSGFEVEGGASPVRCGQDVVLLARLGPLRLHEPVRVVTLLREPHRVGFAYGTLHGHPVRGEEAFLLERTADGSVWFVLRSLTRPGRGWWRLVFPFVLLVQRLVRRRYLRALLRP